MATGSYRRSIVMLIVVSLCISLCGGCAELKYHNLFAATLCGAAVGGVIGHQSDECANGIAVGSAVFFTGELLRQIDDLKEEEVEDAAEEVAKGNHLLAPTYLKQ